MKVDLFPRGTVARRMDVDREAPAEWGRELDDKISGMKGWMTFAAAVSMALLVQRFIGG